MLVVDSGVWIDYFRGVDHPQVERLDRLLDEAVWRIVVPDLVLFEVLRGFRHEREYRQARVLMTGLVVESTAGADLAVDAADHYRHLRTAGRTVRSAVDVRIAAFCIDRGYALLHRDRDFDAFEELRGLHVWRA